MFEARPYLTVVLTALLVGCSVVTKFDEAENSQTARDGGLDGCVPGKGKSCQATCGNGKLEQGESCDPPGSCPRSCDDGTACTQDELVGSANSCNATCRPKPITECKSGDDCCPAECNAGRDKDCTSSCGNGVVDVGETCDPVSNCPSDCNDGNACTVDKKLGSVANCNVMCSHERITRCVADDGCCPPGCTPDSDRDCTTTCGNGKVDEGETCDPQESCPTNCDDGSACTLDTLTGSPESCGSACSTQVITECRAGDGCCPGGCDANSDPDCSNSCGNGIVEPGETCDPKESCPTSCDDGSACTVDQLTGSADNCTAACVAQTVTQCRHEDGCCPAGCSTDRDRDCTASCGNGVIERGETCDPPASCERTCNDGNACTVDRLTGSVENCMSTCTFQAITQCRNDDGCCPAGCNARNDDDCTASCGNGTIEPGETCDPSSSCPSRCNDGNSCTIDMLTGSAANCNVACRHQTITQCRSGDGCCPSGCDSNSDRDCSASCGNDVLERGETCDPRDECPTSCNDGNSCTRDRLTGNRMNCTAACSFAAITQCAGGDGCCPAGCNATNDSDCSAMCGNGVVERGETCDPRSECPTACNDGNACTLDRLTGSAANCNAACSTQTITECRGGDDCCAPGCNASNDSDCSAMCGNGVVERGETCDPRSECPTTCNDGNACTLDRLTGSATNCNAACSTQTITECRGGDDCCAPGCNAANDSDCTAMCGNGVVERGETCDPRSECPMTCDDGNACTLDRLSGSAANCNAACSTQAITECRGGDGCCAPGCTVGTDSDCMARCGDGVVSGSETCDPGVMSGAGRCPTSCEPRMCMAGRVVGSAEACTARCVYEPQTACRNNDDCCPSTCTLGNDNDCSASCGDGVVTPPEKCDPEARGAQQCPSDDDDCDDNRECTADSIAGSGCSAECRNTPITACTSGDGCCPGTCARPADMDCPPLPDPEPPPPAGPAPAN